MHLDAAPWITCRQARDSIGRIEGKIDSWPQVDTQKFSQELRELYERRYQAVCGYVRKERFAELNRKYALSRWEIRRLLKRCLRVHEDGRIWGFRALASYAQVRPHLRIAEVRTTDGNRLAGYGGAMGQLFARYPSIAERVTTHYLRRRKGPNEAWIPIKSSHRVFIEGCRAAGLTESDYPFNVRYLGIRSLARHLKKLFNSHLRKAVGAAFGPDAQRALHTGTGQCTPVVITQPYQRVQFDGHKIDAIWTILIPIPNGGFVEVVLKRLWLLVIQDVASRAILSWHISLNPEYTSEDVLECIRKAVEPWKRRPLTIPKLAYHPNGGMPSGVIQELVWAIFGELCFDNARTHLCQWVRTQVTTILNAVVNPGRVCMPETRSMLESLFNVLEQDIHRLPNTTGSDPNDPRRSEPEEAARRYRISIDHLEQLIAVIIENYNGAPQPAVGWRSPLEQLRFELKNGSTIRRLRPEEQARVNLLAMQISRTVRGNLKQGRRPYVQYEGERYTSEVLARSPDLIGMMLTLIVDEKDLRNMRAFLPDGTDFGFLTAMGRWASTPHSLRTRKAVNRRKVLRVQNNAAKENVDPVLTFVEALREEATGSSRAALQYEYTRREAGLTDKAVSVLPKVVETDFPAPKIPIRPLVSRRRSLAS